MKKNWACFALSVSLLFVVLVPYPAYAAESVPGEVIVMLRGDVTQARGKAESVARRSGAQQLETFDALSEATGVIFARFRSEGRGNGALVSKFSADPDVLCAMPNYIFQRSNRFADAPNDPSYVSGDLWGLKRIGADVAWAISSGDASMRVAVMDGGVDVTHEDLRGNVDVDRSRYFEKNPTGDSLHLEEHGTHVAGTIGAVGDNDIGVVGVNWRTSVISLGIFDPETENETTAAMIGAIDHLLAIFRDEPDIRIPAVNMSFGTHFSQTPLEAIDTPLWHAFKALDNTGRIVLSIAAGNEGFELGAPAPYRLMLGGEVYCEVGDYPYPNSYIGLNNTILVGSTRSDDKASEFSCWSAKHVLIAAPGSEILSTTPGDQYKPLSG
ncbi:S8 family serine peptidase, partial [Synergistaceae bacterium OttesenSCG-928-I11]|nr:S8 family serine peptidase [Synergistaceae bacterium OttesenSCG-928-I11]